MRHPAPTCALVALAALPAAAGPRAEMFADDSGCYLRRYDPGHLAAHPAQTVTAIALAPAPEMAADARLTLAVAVTLRGEDEVYLGYAYCQEEGAALACAMEGDAGRFTLTPAKARALLLDLGRDGLGFEGERGFVELSGVSGDDRRFLIPAAEGPACRGMTAGG